MSTITEHLSPLQKRQFPIPVVERLLALIEEKKSNLCLAADATSSQELLRLADEVGPSLCMLKTHIDILRDFTPRVIDQLSQLAERHHFLLFEDRKFADIGNTVKEQYGGGIYSIARWAHFINLHPLVGPGAVDAIDQVIQDFGLTGERALFLVAEMSAKDCWLNAEYAARSVAMARRYPRLIAGMIAQQRLAPELLQLTPGINFDASGDALGQQYNTPEAAIARGSNILIVGRGITAADTPAATAEVYRSRAWQARIEEP